jgi:hypothetical protein
VNLAETAGKGRGNAAVENTGSGGGGRRAGRDRAGWDGAGRARGDRARGANGAIGYDEYAYALNAKIPVAALRNPAGRYVRPLAANVTVALTAAQINENPHSPDFLQQNLDHVYAFRDPRSYPLSSYSYLVVPRAGRKPVPPAFSRARGRTLSTFLAYLLCPAGQRGLPPLGYARLSPNLVRGGLLVASRIPGHIRVPHLRGGRCT